jgi:hypothetical protein
VDINIHNFVRESRSCVRGKLLAEEISIAYGRYATLQRSRDFPQEHPGFATNKDM